MTDSSNSSRKMNIKINSALETHEYIMRLPIFVQLNKELVKMKKENLKLKKRLDLKEQSESHMITMLSLLKDMILELKTKPIVEEPHKNVCKTAIHLVEPEAESEVVDEVFGSKIEERSSEIFILVVI